MKTTTLSIFALLTIGWSAATAQNPLPGYVVKDGQTLPFVTWIDSVWADHLRARADLMGNDLAREAFYRDALRVDQSSAETVEHLATFYQERKDIPLNYALAAYGRILDPDRPAWKEIRNQLGDLTKLRTLDPADAQRAPPLPGDEQKTLQLARDLIAAGEIMRGELALRSLLEKHPGDSRLLVELGLLYAQTRDWALSIGLFAFAYDLYPATYAIAFNLATGLEQIGKTQAALDIIAGQTRRNPGDPRPLRDATRLARQLDRPEKAMDYAKRWVAVAPTDPDAHLALARLLLAAQRYADADTRADSALKLAPERLDLVALKAETEIRAGKSDAATERLLRIAPLVKRSELETLLKTDPFNQLPKAQAIMDANPEGTP